MKRLGLILVLIVAAGAVWAAWTCYGTARYRLAPPL
jgi:hypothetical protein